ncbi:hypothetical protein QT600_22535, partial [Xanthomonas citri pv. citri]
MGDVDQLIALSVNNPEKTRDGGDDEDEPSSAQQNDGKLPDVFELVDWLLRRFLFLENHQYTALALGILRSFVFREFQHTPLEPDGEVHWVADTPDVERLRALDKTLRAQGVPDEVIETVLCPNNEPANEPHAREPKPKR